MSSRAQRVRAARQCCEIALLVGLLLGGAPACGSAEAPPPAVPTAAAPAIAADAPAAGAVGRTDALASDEIMFVRQAPTVGSVREKDEQKTFLLTLTAEDPKEGPVTVALDERAHTKLRQELLATDGVVPVKLMTTYLTHQVVKLKNGQPQPIDQPPLEGATFVVEKTAAGLKVTDEHGQPVDAPVVALVAKDHKRLGQAKGMAFALPTKPVRVGDSLPTLEQELISEIGTDGQEVSNLTITLAEVKVVEGHRIAVLKASFDSSMPAQGMTMEIGATLVVRDDGRLLQAEMKGPLASRGAASGTGSIHRISSTTYR